MKRKILIGSNNLGKVEEYRALLGSSFEPVPLKYFNLELDVEESGKSYLENAIIKLNALKDKCPFELITDDSGLEVVSLNNEPGLFSARYYGKNASDKRNIIKLLKNLEGIQDRSAKFVCSIAYFNPNSEDGIISSFGECSGKILKTTLGNKGFGYDPIFYVEELGKTFAELSGDQKNMISHRYYAVRDLLGRINI